MQDFCLDRFAKNVSERWAITSAQSFRIFGETRSSPVALDCLIVEVIFQTTTGVNSLILTLLSI